MTQEANSEPTTDLRSLVRQSSTAVWILLMVATCISWWLGTDHSLFISDHRIAGAAVIATAFIKVHFIGRDSMHLHDAPRPLAAVFTAWVVGVGGIVMAIYLLL